MYVVQIRAVRCNQTRRFSTRASCDLCQGPLVMPWARFHLMMRCSDLNDSPNLHETHLALSPAFCCLLIACAPLRTPALQPLPQFVQKHAAVCGTSVTSSPPTPVSASHLVSLVLAGRLASAAGICNLLDPNLLCCLPCARYLLRMLCCAHQRFACDRGRQEVEMI